MKLFVKEEPDILIVLALTFLQLIFIVVDVHNLIRIALGLLLVAFFPGYVILRTFIFNRLLILRTLILSIPVSLAFTVIIGMASVKLLPHIDQTLLQASLITIFIFFIGGSWSSHRESIRMNELTVFCFFLSVLIICVLIASAVTKESISNKGSALYFEGFGDTVMPIEVVQDEKYDLTVNVEASNDLESPQYLQCSDNLLSEVITKGGKTYEFPIHFVSHSLGFKTLECFLKSESKTLSIRLTFNVISP